MQAQALSLLSPRTQDEPIGSSIPTMMTLAARRAQ
jgi:hypothetical protein